LDIAKTEIHATKNKTKTLKKSNSNQHSQDIQSLDPTFFTVIPINSFNESLEEEYCLPSIDLSHWKDEWRVYAEMISKVITKNTFTILSIKRNK